MKRKCLLFMMSALLVLGFGGSVLAAVTLSEDDPQGDTAGGAVTAYDIDKADVFVYPDGAGIEEYVTVGIDMGANKLPGMLMFEFEVDNDTDTGGTKGMPVVFNSCEGGTKIYSPDKPGFDILIMLILRTTTTDAGNAFCDGCTGPGAGQCFEKTVACAVDCGTADCYNTQAGGSCKAEDNNPDCYFTNQRCMDGVSCDSCYEMNTVCASDQDCGIGRRIGEWYANNTIGIGGGESAERGRIEMPYPKGTDETGRDFYTFPWKRLVEAVHVSCAGNPACFNLAAAEDSANIKYQISTWYNADFPAPPADDFFPSDPSCAAVTDVVPNSGMASANITPECCNGDFEPDEDVDGTDAFKFKANFGRRDCVDACPGGM